MNIKINVYVCSRLYILLYFLMLFDYTKPPVNCKFVIAKTSSGQSLYFPMKVKVNSLENYKDNLIHLSDARYTTFTELKYNTSQLVNIFGIPKFKVTNLLGKQILEWKFEVKFENKKNSRDYQHGSFIISTFKTIEKDSELSDIVKGLHNLNVSSCEGKHNINNNHDCEELEYIPLDSTSKWILEVYFDKCPFELVDKNAIRMQSKKIIKLIEKSLNDNLMVSLSDMKL